MLQEDLLCGYAFPRDQFNSLLLPDLFTVQFCGYQTFDCSLVKIIDFLLRLGENDADLLPGKIGVSLLRATIMLLIN